jgi:hypothetical protein
VGVFIPAPPLIMLEAALEVIFGAPLYEGLLSKEVPRFPPETYPPFSYSIEAKLGLKVLPGIAAVGGLLRVAVEYFEKLGGGRRLELIPGFSFSCLFSQVII